MFPHNKFPWQTYKARIGNNPDLGCAYKYVSCNWERLVLSHKRFSMLGHPRPLARDNVIETDVDGGVQIRQPIEPARALW